MAEKVAIFGAGFLGKRALEEKTEWNVVCFIDNDVKKKDC